jgi:hypothetical protein
MGGATTATPTTPDNLAGRPTDFADVTRQDCRHGHDPTAVVIAAAIVKTETAEFLFDLLGFEIRTAPRDQTRQAIDQRVPAIAASKSPGLLSEVSVWVSVSPPAAVKQPGIVLAK